MFHSNYILELCYWPDLPQDWWESPVQPLLSGVLWENVNEKKKKKSGAESLVNMTLNNAELVS